MSIPDAPELSLVVHIRRLSTAGSILYVRIASSDVVRLGLRHGQVVEMDLGRTRIAGIVRTSGGSPWLAPSPGSSNATITAALRSVHLEHGVDVPATVRSLDSAPVLSKVVNEAPPPRVAFRMPDRSLGNQVPLRIDSEEAVRHVRDYNAGLYRGRPNIDLDREAYGRFCNGLSRNLGGLTDQIAFVGEQYGGVQARFLPHDIETEAALIARKLHAALRPWVELVEKAKPLAEEIPEETTLAFLLSPFVLTKQWGVWASKMLHFLRPHVFPILDSNAKKPLGLKNLGSSSRDYHRFSLCLRDVLLANFETLKTARIMDAGESPTDLKLLDKILFQIGMHMN